MRVAVKAFGKINLFLDCLSKRPDGYHEVKMIMQSVRLHDLVEIEAAEENAVFSDSPFVPNNKNNLAMKAACLLQEKMAMPKVAIRIQKNIPVSAGMAGGSSDAAAVLVGCNALFNLGLSTEELESLGAMIGSDVPFCVRGGTAVALGRGEVVRPIRMLPKMHVLLVPADYGVSTAAVYKEVQEKDIHPREDIFNALCQAISEENTAFIARNLYNALETPSFRLEPRTLWRKKRAQSVGVKHILMSGSGPTLFCMFANQDNAWNAFTQLKSVFSNVYLTSTCSSDLINTRLLIDSGGQNG